uniref:Helicase C-terminal domain-containing protein n=1 Tax=Echinostoma caproni TaxID=27848 RepID=A0A183B3H8_9TREM
LVGDLVDEYRNRKERFSQTKSSTPSSTKGSSSTPGYRPLRCLPLHGALPQTDQLRIFDRPTRACRKVIVATNIAEASVTLPGISYVVDCGFARLRAYNPTNALEALVTLPTSQASARQRAGRAGRTRTGEAVALGALDPDTGRLTMPRGLRLAEVSTACGLDQPSAAAALLGACEEGCSQEVAAIVALMQIQRIFVTSAGQKRTGDRVRRQLFGCRQGDHLTELNAFTAYEHQTTQCSPSELKAWCRDAGLNERGLSHALTLRDRIGAMFARLKLPWVRAEPEGNPEPVLRALVRGYFHQVARLAPSGSHYLTVRGDHQLRLHPNSILFSSTSKWPAWILFTHVYLATSAELSGATGFGENRGPGPVPTCVSGVSAIQADWLLELAPHYYQYGTDREHVERALRITG